jgi:hypothetical protein
MCRVNLGEKYRPIWKCFTNLRLDLDAKHMQAVIRSSTLKNKISLSKTGDRTLKRINLFIITIATPLELPAV